MRFRPHPLLSTVGAIALAVPLALIPPGAAAADTPPSEASVVSPEPQQLTQRDDGFPITPVVGLVRGRTRTPTLSGYCGRCCNAPE